MSEKFDYYYGEESESCSFYRIPRLLVLGTRFSGLSTDAKLLYGLMLDRMNLSARNALALVNRVDYFWAAAGGALRRRCGRGDALLQQRFHAGGQAGVVWGGMMFFLLKYDALRSIIKKPNNGTA